MSVQWDRGTNVNRLQAQNAETRQWSGGFSAQIDRLRRYWWLVAAITVAAIVAGLFAAVMGKPSYVGQAVLSAASSARTPDQDATLAQGYTFVFNEPGFQEGLRERAKVGGDISDFNARTAGIGPVFYITATSPSADTARTAAAAMAQTFADEVNSAITASRDKTVETMTEKMQEIVGSGLATTGNTQDHLQEQINVLNADRTNYVTMLRSDAGVSEIEAGRMQTIALAVVCGLLLGCAVALVAGIRSRRIVTDYDAAEKLGLELSDVLPSPTDTDRAEIRAVRLQRLVNVLARQHHARTITVGPVVGGESAREIAESVARLRAADGTPTVLIRADLHASDQRVADAQPGLADLLGGDSAEIAAVLEPVSTNLSVIGPGRPVGDPYALFGAERLSGLIDDLRERATFIVVEAPPLALAGEAQVISDVTDGTLLIIEQGDRVDDVREAVRAIDQVGARIIGVVLAETDRARFQPRPKEAADRDTRASDAYVTAGSDGS